MVQIMLPGAMIIAKLMDHEIGRRDQKITSIYWSVSTTAVSGILDQVRTRMALMLGELRAVTPAGSALPTPADASRAVSIVIRGKNNRVNVAHAVGASATLTAHASEREDRFWMTGRRVGATLVGACTVVSTVIAWLQLQSG